MTPAVRRPSWHPFGYVEPPTADELDVLIAETRAMTAAVEADRLELERAVAAARAARGES